jgi:hypothetical protein
MDYDDQYCRSSPGGIMKELLKAAHEDIARQIGSEERAWCDMGAVKRLVATSLVSAGLVIGGVSPAHAGDGSTFGAIIGGAVGTLGGAAATRHQSDYAVRAAAMVAAGAAGTWAGKAVGERIDAPRQDPRAVPNRSDGYYDGRAQVREVVVVERVEPVRVVQRYDTARPGQAVERFDPPRDQFSSRAYQRDADRGWESREQARGDLLFSPEASGFNPVLCAALARNHMQMAASGGKELSSNPVFKARLGKAVERLLVSSREYAGKIDAWDDAATLIGPEGVAARTKAAESLIAARRDLDGRAVEYVQVRNVLAQQGFNVSDVDNAVIDRTSGLTEPARYVFNDGGRPPRPGMR